jgi:DNA (cytosine-5)-methyltransferase 3A
MRLLHEVKPKYFLLENVEMGEKWERVLSKAIGVNGIHINSALVSAQNRKRIYWTNIGHEPGGLFGDLVCMIKQPKDRGIMLKDILEPEVDEKYYLSEKMIASMMNHAERHKDDGFGWKPTDGSKKGASLTTKAGSRPADNYIVHNTMPRSGDPSKGGTGHLSRSDGKTYCLDTGNTNAVEIVEMRGREAVLTSKRTEFGKAVRKDYEAGNIELQRKNIQQLEPRTDGKTNCLTSVQKDNLVSTQTRIRRLTPLECERLQTVKDGYSEGVSDTQRYRMLGNGWTVEVIAYIFSYLQPHCKNKYPECLVD